MTTDISVSEVAHQVENRSWLLSPHGTDPGTTPSVTLDISAFTPTSRFSPNGFIPSGTVIGREGPDDLWEPYDGGGENGEHTEVGILFSSLKVPRSGANPGGACVVHGFVNPARLPFQTGTGSLGEDGRTALPLIHFGA